MDRAQGTQHFSDKRFRALIERSFDVIALIDSKARIIYASPSIVRLYGRSPSEFLGLSGLLYIHPADLPKIAKLLAYLLLHPKQSIETELRIKHRDGHWCWVYTIATNLLGDKEIRGIVVNFHDITQRKELEARKDEFISIASHELKTPITSLKMYVQLLKRQAQPPANRYLEHMDNQLDRLTQLINELLDVTRIQEGKLELKKEDFDLIWFVRDVVEDVRRVNTHRISVQGAAEIRVNADKSHLTQVLTNLLTNAMKHSPKGSRIVVRCVRKTGRAEVSVRDYGEGIESANLDKIFDKYFQERHRKHRKGLGLGLYISSEIIKQHGGKIWVKSEKNKGSTFTFSLLCP